MIELYFKILFTTFLLLLNSCFVEKAKDPSDILKTYIQLYSSPDIRKEQFLEHLTGDLHSNLDHLTADEFSQYLKQKDYHKRTIKIIRENCLVDTCYITYTLKYIKKKELVVETKKIAELKKVSGKWKISSVDNIKTYIDSKKSLK